MAPEKSRTKKRIISAIFSPLLQFDVHIYPSIMNSRAKEHVNITRAVT